MPKFKPGDRARSITNQWEAILKCVPHRRKFAFYWQITRHADGGIPPQGIVSLQEYKPLDDDLWLEKIELDSMIGSVNCRGYELVT